MTCFDESISVRGRCSRSLRAVFLLGFLLYGLTVTAQETGRDVSAGTSESLRQKTKLALGREAGYGYFPIRPATTYVLG